MPSAWLYIQFHFCLGWVPAGCHLYLQFTQFIVKLKILQSVFICLSKNCLIQKNTHYKIELCRRTSSGITHTFPSISKIRFKELKLYPSSFLFFLINNLQSNSTERKQRYLLISAILPDLHQSWKKTTCIRKYTVARFYCLSWWEQKHLWAMIHRKNCLTTK